MIHVVTVYIIWLAFFHSYRDIPNEFDHPLWCGAGPLRLGKTWKGLKCVFHTWWCGWLPIRSIGHVDPQVLRSALTTKAFLRCESPVMRWSGLVRGGPTSKYWGWVTHFRDRTGSACGGLIPLQRKTGRLNPAVMVTAVVIRSGKDDFTASLTSRDCNPFVLSSTSVGDFFCRENGINYELS